MKPDEQLRRKRGRRLILLLVALCIALPLGVWLFDTFGPNPPIIVSKATTHLTTPLAADGLPDYDAVTLARWRKGVTPENNGAVLFWRVMWDKGFGDGSDDYKPEDLRRFCQEIGLPYPPPKTDRIEPMASDLVRKQSVAWLREKLPPPDPAAEDSAASPPLEEWSTAAQIAAFHAASDEEAEKGELVDEVVWGIYDGRPWRRDELPPMAAWLDRNQKQIDRLVEAMERPRWHSPPPGMLNGERTWDVTLPTIQTSREATRILSARALHRIAEGELAAAWRDLRAVFTLVPRISQGDVLVDNLVGIAIAGIAVNHTQMLLDAPA